jgi:hypothetical protein
MKITIDLSEEATARFKQYITREAEYQTQLANKYEQEGKHIVAECLRIPLTPERVVRELVLGAIRERG